MHHRQVSAEDVREWLYREGLDTLHRDVVWRRPERLVAACGARLPYGRTDGKSPEGELRPAEAAGAGARLG